MFKIPFAPIPYNPGEGPATTSDEIVEKFTAFAKDCLLKYGEHPPLFVFSAPTSYFVVHMGPLMKDNETKDVFAVMIRRVLEKHKATAYVMITEAWTADYGGLLDGLSEEQALEAMRKMPAPSLMPTRKEILSIMGQSRGGKTTGRIFEIIRNDEEKVTGVVENLEQRDKLSGCGGRFSNLFDPIDEFSEDAAHLRAIDRELGPILRVDPEDDFNLEDK